MNRQWRENGRSRGIEWTDYTWNMVGGCLHDCEWEMPDGSVAECYAKTVAENLAVKAYPEGFRHHYWHPGRARELTGAKEPSLIFVDSMSDLFGANVPEAQIQQVLDVCRQYPQHAFQSLTKNPGKLLKFRDQIPTNFWIGVSMPPTFMFGERMSPAQQTRYMGKAVSVLKRFPNHITWISFEPLSWDVSRIMEGALIKWAVIGAASNGRTYYQPEREHVERLHRVLDRTATPVFHKGNLDWEPRREDFPVKLLSGPPPAVLRRYKLAWTMPGWVPQRTWMMPEEDPGYQTHRNGLAWSYVPTRDAGEYATTCPYPRGSYAWNLWWEGRLLGAAEVSDNELGRIVYERQFVKR